MKTIIFGDSRYMERTLLRPNQGEHKKSENKKSFLYFVQSLFTCFVGAALIIGSTIWVIMLSSIYIDPLIYGWSAYKGIMG